MNRTNTLLRDEINHDEPWRLSLTPNYQNAMEVDSVSAETISQAEFYEKYVKRNRPCLLVGAVKHWPASKKWRDIDYLKKKTANVDFLMRKDPPAEQTGFIKDKALRESLSDQNRNILIKTTFHDFLGQCNPDNRHVLFVNRILSTGSLSELHGDMGTFPFMPVLDKSFYFPPYRAFFYNRSYTDWHFHSFDEALMCQVVGEKEVVLLPPDQQSWDAILPVVKGKGIFYGVDPKEFPEFSNIRPLKVVVGEGDALYIPVYWWHAVATVDDDFGVTVAATFRSPKHVIGDMRLPPARALVKLILSQKRAYYRGDLLVALYLISYSYLYRAGGRWFLRQTVCRLCCEVG